jgi:hypothetical protein
LTDLQPMPTPHGSILSLLEPGSTRTLREAFRLLSAVQRWTFDSTRHVSVLYEGPPGVVTDGIPGGLYLYDAGSNLWTLTSVAGGPIPTTETTNPVCHGRLSIAYDSLTDSFVATELGSLAYVLYAWELPGTSIKVARSGTSRAFNPAPARERAEAGDKRSTAGSNVPRSKPYC